MNTSILLLLFIFPMLVKIFSKSTIPAFQFAKLKLSVAPPPTFSIIEALQMVKTASKRNFDETIDFQLKFTIPSSTSRLNVDPKHGEQNVRGNCVMPGGLGKTIIIAAFLPEKY